MLHEQAGGDGGVRRAVYGERATHDFPLEAKIPAEWGLELDAVAKDLGSSIRTTSQIQDRSVRSSWP
jgi:hypothetical protein